MLLLVAIAILPFVIGYTDNIIVSNTCQSGTEPVPVPIESDTETIGTRHKTNQVRRADNIVYSRLKSCLPFCTVHLPCTYR